MPDSPRLGLDLARAATVIVTSVLEHHRPDLAKRMVGLTLTEGIVIINEELGTKIDEKKPPLHDLVYQLCVAIHESKRGKTNEVTQ